MSYRKFVTSIVLSLAAGTASLLVGGFAHAEEAVVKQTSTVEVSSTSDVTVTSDHSSVTTVGGSTSDDGQTQPTATQSVTSDLKINDNPFNGASGPTAAPAEISLSPTKTAADTKPAAIESPTPPTGLEALTAPAQKNTYGNVHNSNAFIQTTFVPQSPAVPSANSTPASPSKPLPATGALGQISALMGQIIIPAAKSFGGFASSAAHSPVATRFFLLVLLTAVGAVIRQFVLWLKRSGFAHAARSDASPLFFFATPQKMSFVWATEGPAASSSFYGVRNTKLIPGSGRS